MLARRLALTFALAVAGVLVLAAPGHAAPACAMYASPSGDDQFGNGSSAVPWRTAQKLVDSLSTGQTGCLKDGTYAERVTITRDGITLSSEFSTQRPTIAGVLRIDGAAADVTVQGLTLDGRTVNDSPGVVVNGDRARIIGNEIRNDTLTCFYAGSTAADEAVDLLVEGNRVHDCAPSGISLSYTLRARVVDNYVYVVAGRGIQLYPRALDSVVARNVIDAVEDGIQFGGSPTETSSGNAASANVIRAGSVETSNWDVTYNWEGPAGTGNSATGNCLDTDGSEIRTGGGITESGNVLVGDPGFVNAAGRDYSLTATSACKGKGPLPAARTGGPAEITRASATVTGTVNPHFQVTEYFFEYGPTAALGSTSAIGLTQATSIEEAIDRVLTGLEPGRTYHYRLVARNPSGRTEGAVETFAVPALADADGDGVPDEREPLGCAQVPGGAFDANNDGCPDDTDGDQVIDEHEAPGCRDIHRGAVDRDNNGCPDDSDGDGVIDEREAPGCVHVHRGTIDGNGDGCPDNSDADPVLDQHEAPGCVTLDAGRIDRNGDGCPDNSDNDQVIDERDDCDKVTARVDRNRDGCPDAIAAGGLPRFTYLGGRLTSLSVTVQKGARVAARCASKCRASYKTTARRVARRETLALVKLRRFVGLRLVRGMVIEIRATRRHMVGAFWRLEWTGSSMRRARYCMRPNSTKRGSRWADGAAVPRRCLR